ncbi:hypothetical protein D3C73_781240 [compost metagenome]
MITVCRKILRIAFSQLHVDKHTILALGQLPNVVPARTKGSAARNAAKVRLDWLPPAIFQKQLHIYSGNPNILERYDPPFGIQVPLIRAPLVAQGGPIGDLQPELAVLLLYPRMD